MALVADKATYDGHQFYCVTDDVSLQQDCFYMGVASTTPHLSTRPFGQTCSTYFEPDGVQRTYCYDPLKAEIGILIFILFTVSMIVFIYSRFKKI